MIPLYKPFMPEELPEMNAILHSGALAYGKWGREFEKSLEAYTGSARRRSQFVQRSGTDRPTDARHRI